MSKPEVKMYRLEAINHDGKFELVKILDSFDKVVNLAENHLDRFYMRIVECGRPRRTVWQNFTRYVPEY